MECISLSGSNHHNSWQVGGSADQQLRHYITNDLRLLPEEASLIPDSSQLCHTLALFEWFSCQRSVKYVIAGQDPFKNILEEGKTFFVFFCYYITIFLLVLAARLMSGNVKLVPRHLIFVTVATVNKRNKKIFLRKIYSACERVLFQPELSLKLSEKI